MNKVKTILITGANGLLGGTLVKEVIENSANHIVAVARDKNKIFEMLEREKIRSQDRVTIITSDELLSELWNNIDVAVHMAFSRANMPNENIAASLDYTKNVLLKFRDAGIQNNIYISSQSIYGPISDFRSERNIPAPDSVYAMAKYAGEKLFEEAFDKTNVKHSILRLDYVIQSQKLVSYLCRDAKEKGVINLRGGNQTFSYIDKRDVAKAITALISFEGSWKPIYNVGPDKMRYSLIEIADIVKKVAESHGDGKIEIHLEKSEIELWSGMDSTLFMSDTGWKPSMDIFQMVESIYRTV